MFRKARSKTATDFEPSTDVFPSIASGPIAQKLKLEKRGRTDGTANYPASDSTGLTVAEQEAVSEISRLRKRGIDAFDMHFNAYQNRIDSSQSLLSHIHAQAGKLRHEMASESNTQQNIVLNKLKAVREYSMGLADYQRRHRLTGPPKHASSPIVLALFIVVFLALEIILSAFFFRENSPGGLIGSATYAFMIALVNVAISSLLGHFSRYASLQGAGHKLVGVLSWLAFFTFAVGFNIFVGHYRKATDEMAWSEAPYAMFDSFKSTPFDLGSFNAILIVVFGVVVSILAFLKLRSWEDVHPGYNRAYTAVHKAIEEYGDAYQETEQTLNELFEESKDALISEAHKLRATLRDAANAHAAQMTLVGNLAAFLEESGQVANALLRTYREANQKARSTPPPKSFEEAYSFPMPSQRHIPEFASDRIEFEITRINEAVERGVQDILDARQIELTALPKTDVLIHGIEKGVIPDSSSTATSEAVSVERV